jgi:fumarate hydratase class II
MSSYRIEKDSLGEVKVPEGVYYGAQTQRAIDNFQVSGIRFGRRFIWALGLIKRACAETNEELGLLDTQRAEWISAAAREVMDGKLDAQFPLEIFQTGSGTSTNMNANEVISNRAIELMGGVIGSKTPVHPNDHVNMCQSSNDVIPTAIHVAGAVAIHEDLIPALRHLHQALAEKAKAWDGIVKSGRTHLMDATPVRLGQEFGGYARRSSTRSSERSGRATCSSSSRSAGRRSARASTARSRSRRSASRGLPRDPGSRSAKRSITSRRRGRRTTRWKRRAS